MLTPLNVRFFAFALTACISLMSFVTSGQDTFSYGCEFENIDTARVLKANFPQERGSLPASFSLKQYAPKPKSQGPLNSCAAWSSAYAGLTIIKGIEYNSAQNPCDPIHLYNRIQTSLNREPCIKGSTIEAALKILKTNGCALYGEYSQHCGPEPLVQKFPTNLYDFQHLENSVISYKKSLINKQPIIAGFIAYQSTGWDSGKNIINGVWNGKFEKEPLGGHGMCIVGFDDNKEGGAFEIMNSWGENWGDGGFFWIKYTDIIKNIKYAYSLIPHPKENQQLPPQVFANNIEVHNNCIEPLYLAIATQNDGEWNSKGWYIIQPFDKSIIDVSNRTSNEILWTATNEKRSVLWNNPESAVHLCIDSTQSFEFNDQSCSDPIGFYSITPKQNQETFAFHIGCPSFSGRNGNVLYLPEYFTTEKDRRTPEEANQYWLPKFGLFDLSTQQLIAPTLNENETLEYNIWVTDGYADPENKTFTAAQLELDNRYKFQSQSSALNFINWKRK